MQGRSNYQDFLKVIAIVSMVIDHIGLYFLPEYPIMRLIGRIAMPIFCFFAGYNFKKHPSYKVFIFGTLLHLISSLFIFKQPITANILVSIFIGQCYIYLFQNYLKDFFKGYFHVILLASCWGLTRSLIDYGTLSIATMVLGNIAKNDEKSLNLAVAISIVLSVFHTIAVFEFTKSYMIATIIVGILLHLAMSARKFNHPINVQLNVVSRNVLVFYFVHLVIIELIWYISYYT